MFGVLPGDGGALVDVAASSGMHDSSVLMSSLLADLRVHCCCVLLAGSWCYDASGSCVVDGRHCHGTYRRTSVYSFSGFAVSLSSSTRSCVGVGTQGLYYLGDTLVFLQKAKLIDVDGDALTLRTNRTWCVTV